MTDDLRAAVSAGVLGAEESYRSLLQSIVEVARAIFSAKASSVLLLDESTDALVFEAVAGEGADTLVGKRLPSDTGAARAPSNWSLALNPAGRRRAQYFAPNRRGRTHARPGCR